jgi:zinc/manganese transport system permease protein
MLLFDLLQYPFLQNAFLAGTIIAITAAIVGYFIILRGLTFAAEALSDIGFAGAAGAVMLGVTPVYGLLIFTICAGISIGLLGKEVRERDIAVGIIMTLAVGLGLLFLTLYQGYAEEAYSILFGTILGISSTNILVTALFSIFTLATLLFMFRPLLFSSIDPEVAQARGIPVRLLSIMFLIIVAITISVAVQIIGVLLIFTLLVGPAATSVRLVHRPLWAIVLAILLGLLFTWIGITLAVYTNWPVSFWIATLSFGIYLPVRLLSPLWMGRRGNQPQVNSEQSAKQPLLKVH